MLRSAEALDEGHAAWRAAQCHPWSDLAYYKEHLTREAGFRRPHVLVLREADRAGLLAGRIVEEKIAWRVGGKALLHSQARVLRVGNGGLMGLDTPASAEAAVTELRAALVRGEADLVYLHQLAEDSHLARAARRVPMLARDRFVRSTPSYQLELPATYEEFLRSRSKSVKKGLKRARTVNLRDLQAPRIERYVRPDDLDVLLRDECAIVDKTYQRRIGVGLEDNEETRERLAWLLRAGYLRAHVLYEGETPIAFWHHIVYGNTAHTRETGYDPEYSRLRPGIFLIAEIIEEMCADPNVEWLDFGAMEADYKRNLSTKKTPLQSMYIFSSKPRGLVMTAKRAATGATDRIARALLGSKARKWARRLRG